MKRLFALLLSCSMVLTLLAGCAEKPGTDPQQPDNPAKVETHVVVDNGQKEINVPNQIDRIAIISTMPLCSVYCMVGGDAAKIVGLTPASKNAAVHSFLSRVADLSDVDTAFAQGETVNVEEVMNLKPDVVFYNNGNEADVNAADKLTKLGVPCVGFSTSIESTIETVNTWATLLGQVLGTEMKADEIIAYGKDVEKMVTDRVSQIPAEERRSALILANYNESAIVAAGSTFGRYWLSTIGADNVAKDIEQKISPVSLEQIYEWDPDVIFLNSFSSFTPEDIANGTAIEGHDWSGLTSVRHHEFYKLPLGMYYWFPPCSDSPLALQWMAQKLYPNLFDDINMDRVIKDYYQRFYDVTLTDEDMETLYNPPADSAM